MCAKFDIMMFFWPSPTKYKRWTRTCDAPDYKLVALSNMKWMASPHKRQLSIEEFTWIGFYCVQQSTSTRTIEINYNHRPKCNLCTERLWNFNHLVGDYISSTHFRCQIYVPSIGAVRRKSRIQCEFSLCDRPIHLFVDVCVGEAAALE